MSKPSIGQHVIYHVRQDNRYEFRNGVTDLPAIITFVHSDTQVDLQVLPNWVGVLLWRGSVEQGDGQGQWSWPVFEKEDPVVASSTPPTLVTPQPVTPIIEPSEWVRTPDGWKKAEI